MDVVHDGARRGVIRADLGNVEIVLKRGYRWVLPAGDVFTGG